MKMMPLIRMEGVEGSPDITAKPAAVHCRRNNTQQWNRIKSNLIVAEQQDKCKPLCFCFWERVNALLSVRYWSAWSLTASTAVVSSCSVVSENNSKRVVWILSWATLSSTCDQIFQLDKKWKLLTVEASATNYLEESPSI